MTTKIAATLLALVLFGSFTTFVWPTRWRYDHMTVGGDTYPVRIDRITGSAWVLLPGDGWTPDEDVTDEPQGDSEQPQLHRS